MVSCDSHVGPLLEEQLRPYCPTEHLERFDEFVDGPPRRWSPPRRRASSCPSTPRWRSPAITTRHARLDDMDREGIAAEVIYHFSMNGEPLPFVTNPAGGLAAVPADGLELGAVGYRIYNRWLADFVATDPHRLLGLAYIPSWDIEASVREVRMGGRTPGWPASTSRRPVGPGTSSTTTPRGSRSGTSAKRPA